MPGSGASAVLSAGTATTNALGVATITASANATAGSYAVTASVGALTTTFSLTNTLPFPPVLSAVAGTPQTTVINTAFATALQVSLTDPAGIPISGKAIFFNAPSTGPSATVSRTSVVTDAKGLATITATANGTAGQYSLLASGDQVSIAFNLTNLPEAPSSLTATGGTPQSATISLAFGTALQATLRGADGAPLGNVAVTFSAPTSGAGALLSSQGAYTNEYGVASVAAKANGIAGSYLVTATVGNLTATFALSNFSSSAITISALRNAASMSDPLGAPNDIMTAFGNFPGCASATVTVDGAVAQVLASSAGQVNFVLPASVAGEAKASVQFSCAGLTSQPFELPIAAVAPGLFTLTQSGQGQAASVNQDGTPGSPTPASTYLSLYGTGFGLFNSPSPDGLSRLALPVNARLVTNPGTPQETSIPLTVQYAGAAPGETSGLQQINVFIPLDAPLGPQLIVLSINGAETQPGVTIRVTGPTVSQISSPVAAARR